MSIYLNTATVFIFPFFSGMHGFIHYNKIIKSAFCLQYFDFFCIEILGSLYKKIEFKYNYFYEGNIIILLIMLTSQQCDGIILSMLIYQQLFARMEIFYEKLCSSSFDRI